MTWNLSWNWYHFIGTKFILTRVLHTRNIYFLFFYLSIYPSIFDWNYQSKSAWTTFHLSSTSKGKTRRMLGGNGWLDKIHLSYRWDNLLNTTTTLVSLNHNSLYACTLFIFPPFTYQVSSAFSLTPCNVLFPKHSISYDRRKKVLR